MGRRLNQPDPAEKAKLSLRIDFAEGRRLGPGKVLLLEAVAKHGSISAAARSINMSYKRAWDLIEELNHIFSSPVIDSKSGGPKGGGAALTKLGGEVVAAYREMERKTQTVSKTALKGLLRHLS